MRANRFLVSLLLLLLACGSAAAAESNVMRRFASPEAQGEEDASTLCHHIHLLPVGSTLHARALEACQALRPSLPKKVIDEPGSPTLVKKNFKDVFDEQKLKSIEAQKARVRTPTENAGLAALDAKQTKVQDLQTKTDAQMAVFKNDAVAAEQQAAKDAADRAAQRKVQLDDQLNQAKYQSDIDAGVQAKVDDALDVKRVENAKAEWVKLEDSIATAKAKAAKDAEVVAAYDTKLKAATEQRQKAEAERLADQAEAQRDKDLADSADKAAREQARIERQKLRDARAQELENSLGAAAAERKAAVERQQLLLEEEAVRLKLQKQIDDTEVSLVTNRKNREVEQLEREKRLTAFNKVEEDIKLRRAAFKAAEDARLARAKAREEAALQRLKAQAQADADLAKAKEDEGPPEGRKQQDDEEECTDKTVNCNGGKCLQLKNDPKVKRCQCDDDAGSNCQFPPCEYDIDDGTGKSKKQKGHTVNGQCVRWNAEYRCQCDKAWRLDVKCMKKQGVREIQVPDRECLEVRKPENEYGNQICELCQCPRGRGLETNTTASTESYHRMLNGCEEVKTCVSERMVITTKKYSQPELIKLQHKHLYQAIPVDSNEACLDQCERRAGMSGKASSDRRQLKARTHCTWVYIKTDAETGKLTCYIFFTGKLPDLHVQSHPTKRHKAESTGFVGFVKYPRRWDLYRQATGREHSRKFCGRAPGEKFEVFFGLNTAKHEGEGTYARDASHTSTDCIGQPQTVLENAEGYARRLPKKRKGELVAIPPEWAKYENTKRKPAKVDSMNSQLPVTQLPWTYTVDDHFRVTNVEGVSMMLHVGKRVDEEFEATYKWVTDRMWATAQAAPFCAGHLVAYQQLPPNFYFNYVPQHENSNSNGCWFLAEEAAANLIRLGCHLSYNINLDYGLHGERKPSEIKNMMPDMAKDNPIIYKPPSRPKPGKTAAPRPPPSYVNDDLKCHYRYRPYIMNLNFHIVDATENCDNLHKAIQSRPATSLLSVSGKTIVTSRIFAYLLQKKPKPSDPETGKGTDSFKRMLGAATAMKKDSAADSAMSCFAETGNIAPFTKVQMNLDFHNAYLGDVDHKKCLLRPGTKTCEKWSMKPDKDDSHFGVLLNSDEECLTADTGSGSGSGSATVTVTGSSSSSSSGSGSGTYLQDVVLKHELDPSAKCGVFEYDVKGRTFDPSQLNPIQRVEGARIIDDFLIGTVTFGKDRCLDPNGKIVKISDPAEECWKLRISYYNFASQRRALQDDADDDDDDDQNSTCSAVEFTDDWDDEE